MSNGETYRRFIAPVVLIIIAYVGYIFVDVLIKTTPGFSDNGWYIYGAMITAIVFFIIYDWLQYLDDNPFEITIKFANILIGVVYTLFKNSWCKYEITDNFEQPSSN